MRRSDEQPIDPWVADELRAIDATLRGEPVDPEHAELAELTVLLAAERPAMDDRFAHQLDERVADRFRAAAARRPRRRLWTVSGLAAAAASAAVAVVIAGSGTRPVAHTATTAAKAPPTTATGSASSAQPAQAPSTPPAAIVPSQPSGGRKIVQSAQLALTTPPVHVEDVAQQVFGVVGAENGYVSRSTVTATGGPDGYAQFELSIPGSSLPDTMARLSRLRYAQVASRTDTTQDVNDQYVQLTRRLDDARALRTALLKQLANASTPQQVASLKAQIHDAEGAISSAQAALNSLNHQINYTQVSLSINADVTPVGGGGFTIRRAAHDAGHVLTVAAGVALIVLAALVPLGLVVGLLWWGYAALRRRRREQALDLA